MDLLEKFISENRNALDLASTPPRLWAKVEDDLCAHVKEDLEQYIGSNREALDSAAPSPGLWEKIDQNLRAVEEKKPEKTTFSVSLWPRYLMRAAAAVFLLACGFGIGMKVSNNAEKTSEIASVLTPEQEQAINVFEREVALKSQKVATFVNQSPEVKADLARLDQAALELKNDLQDVPPGNREQVVHAMLENYKAKVHILERILSHYSHSDIQGNNTSNNVKNETTEL